MGKRSDFQYTWSFALVMVVIFNTYLRKSESWFSTLISTGHSSDFQHIIIYVKSEQQFSNTCFYGSKLWLSFNTYFRDLQGPVQKTHPLQCKTHSPRCSLQFSAKKKKKKKKKKNPTSGNNEKAQLRFFQARVRTANQPDHCGGTSERPTRPLWGHQWTTQQTTVGAPVNDPATQSLSGQLPEKVEGSVPKE